MKLRTASLGALALAGLALPLFGVAWPRLATDDALAPEGAPSAEPWSVPLPCDEPARGTPWSVAR